MNPQDPLANLHPLRLPEPIGWWPLAPGWWFLLLASLLLVAMLIYLVRKHFRKNAYRRRALRQLQSLHAQFLEKNDASLYLTQLNALLKSVALLAYCRSDVAARHGANWRVFLNRSLPPAQQLQPPFDNAVYQRTCPDVDVLQVHRAARHWILHHRGTP